MYLHIGNGYSIKINDILGIFDIENTTVGKYTKDFLEHAEKQKHCVYVTSELPKSFIVTAADHTETVYISQLAVSTLKKRLSEISGLNHLNSP